MRLTFERGVFKKMLCYLCFLVIHLTLQFLSDSGIWGGCVDRLVVGLLVTLFV